MVLRRKCPGLKPVTEAAGCVVINNVLNECSTQVGASKTFNVENTRKNQISSFRLNVLSLKRQRGKPIVDDYAAVGERSIRIEGIP